MMSWLCWKTQKLWHPVRRYNNDGRKISARIDELESQRDMAVQAYKDKDAEITDLTNQLSEQGEALREQRGNFALEASGCQQKIDELKALFLYRGPVGGES